MTSLLESVLKEDSSLFPKQVIYRIPRHQCRYVLSSRENFIPKCSKCYKRKYKKHRLRKNEPEDEDVLNVSSILTSSLTIQSPYKGKSNLDIEIENLRPKNYLFKMVRKRQDGATIASETAVSRVELNQNEHSQESSTSQERKSTNAFKLLMDSRNKSLGSNSPGKEKSIDELEMKDIMEKKSLKAKRNLVLQQMAEVKGSLKKKEMEEYQDKLIKKKMEKRAKKLKSMILHKEPKVAQIEKGGEIVTKPRSPLNSLNEKKNEKCNDKPAKTLQLVNLFEECGENGNTQKIKTIAKEDQEFLKKLSPSIKKKQSMLSYFSKVEKEVDTTENESEIIKVKFTPKSKKRGRKVKLSLKRDDVDLYDDANSQQETVAQAIADDNSDKINIPEQNSKVGKKRKRKTHEVDILSNNNFNDSLTMDTLNQNGTRPKRTVKKPIKYSENYISSSDEELHIFTPKKKKESVPKSTTTNGVVVEQDIIKCDGEEIKTKPKLQKTDKVPILSKKEKNTKGTKQEKKHVKLAPIFTPKLDAAAIEAKQRFLKSGVPDKLKKIIARQRDINVVTDSFFKVVHIQQLDSSNKVAQTLLDFRSQEIDDQVIDYANSEKKIFEQLLNLNNYSNLNGASHLKNNNSIQYFLQHLKESYQKFPVYRTYKLMRSKKKGEFKPNYSYLDLDNSVEFLNGSIDIQVDNPDQLNWCDKYKPLAANQIIGNFNSITELKKWLITWTENEVKAKRASKSYESDSSDFCYSDVDSRDSTKTFNNLLILSGPVGSGKTSSVYAVANELSIKVIEVNASSKRTGKIMLQDLQEATQSHKVNRGTGSNENSQKSEEVVVTVPKETKIKKRGRPKKNLDNAPKKLVAEKNDRSTLTASQDSTRTAMSLILIDDADIVFDQDDGFCSAIVQLVQCSKRPVILITRTLTCPHLNRFMQGSKILTMNPLLPNMLGTWLDIMCLADSGMCYPGAGAKLLDFFKGDIRKTINCLQFYICSQTLNGEKEPCFHNIDEKLSNAEENSNISWSEPEHFEVKSINKVFELDDIWTNHSNTHINLLHFKNHLELFNIWWSVPKLLRMPEFRNLGQKKGATNDNSREDDKAKDRTRLQSLSYLFDVISECDYMTLMPSKDRRSSLTSHPWVSYENDSVSESENFDNYDLNHEMNKEICYEYMKGSIALAQEKLELASNFDVEMPGTTVQR